jgi:hypothetical protein
MWKKEHLKVTKAIGIRLLLLFPQAIHKVKKRITQDGTEVYIIKKTQGRKLSFRTNQV